MQASSDYGTCDHCGEVITESTVEDPQYCSAACYNQQQQEQSSKVESVCEHCGEKFTHYRSQPRKYCSQDCYHQQESVKEPATTSCQHCGDDFDHEPSHDRKFCSEDCYLTARRNGYGSNKVERTTTECENCGEGIEHKVTKDRSFCSIECMHGVTDTEKILNRWGDTTLRNTDLIEALDGYNHPETAARILVASGYESTEDIREAEPSDLLEIDGIGRSTVAHLCRNLSYPWDTPNKYLPSPPESRNQPESQRELSTGSGEEVEDTHDSAYLDQCPACEKPLSEGEVHDHIFDCPEVGSDLEYTDAA